MDSMLAIDRLALIDLSGPGHYLTWGVIQISYANLIVILLMIAVFVLALVVPFPGRRRPTASGTAPTTARGPGSAGRTGAEGGTRP